MRTLFLLLLLPLAACQSGAVPAGYALAAGAGGLVAFQRTVPDIVISSLSGRNCSVVHFDQGRPYCSPRPAKKPPAPPSCTPSLGIVDCWTAAALPPDSAGEMVADAPAPTAAQLAYRRAGWLGQHLGF